MSGEAEVVDAVLLNSRPVKTQGHIPVPREVRGVVGVSGEDSSTFWNYDRENDYVVLSNQALNGDNYDFADLSDFYEEKQNGDRDVRPPAKLPERIQDNFQSSFGEGVNERENRVFFVATAEMIDEGPHCVYLLNTSQMTDLLAVVPFDTSRGIAGSDVDETNVRPSKVNASGQQIEEDWFRERQFEDEGVISLQVNQNLDRPR
jgi:hypothetical protein